MTDILMMGPYPEWDMVEMEASYHIHKLWLAVDRDGFIDAHAPSIRAIATWGDAKVTADLMSRLPKLELVAGYGVGTDGIDLEHARRHGIRVTNTPDVLTEDVADLGIGLLLGIARQIPQADAYVRSGRWRDGPKPLVSRFHGKRLGILGMGRIGAALARRAAAFGCSIAYFGRRRREDLPYRFISDLVELARQSDFLAITVPGGEPTRNLVDGKVLDALGPEGFLVNIARGSVVDEDALLSALEAGRLKGAALDVFWNEPLIDERFFDLPNVVLQPHHGSATLETRMAMGRLLRDNLAAHFSGAPLLTPVV